MKTENGMEITQKTEKIIACVSIMGAKRGCGWKYTIYKRAKNGGWIYEAEATHGMYPNKRNHLWSLNYEASLDMPLVYGRPVAK
jgi:uncharacterized protein YceK